MLCWYEYFRSVSSTVCFRHTESGFSSMGTGVGRSQTVEAQSIGVDAAAGTAEDGRRC